VQEHEAKSCLVSDQQVSRLAVLTSNDDVIDHA
jgi:hypothetical protein